MTNSDFPRILTLLRKERGFSQKKAAADLGISQALLSHYEKGIRECGLDFLVRAANYYQVSCDYLLGRTPHRNGAAVCGETAAGEGAIPLETETPPAPDYHLQVLVNSLHIVFGILKKINSEGVTQHVSAYLSDGVYKMFRMLYSARGKNPQEVFSLDRQLCVAQTGTHMIMEEAQAQYLLEGKNLKDASGIDPEVFPLLTPGNLLDEYPQHAPSLFELVQSTERSISR